MRKLFFILSFVLLPVLCFAGGMGPGPGLGAGSSGPSNIPFGNPGFESAITTTENVGNWWGGLDNGAYGTGGGVRTASGVMSGSYVGDIQVSETPSSSGHCDGTGDTAYSGTVYADCIADNGGWIATPVNVDAWLGQKFAVATIDASTGKTTFDFRIVGAYYSNSAYILALVPKDSGGNAIIKTANGEHLVYLAGTLLSGSGIDTSVKVASPAVNTNYTITNYDIKSRITSELLTGKTWADVSTVTVYLMVFDAYGNNAEMYVDNFR